MLLFVEFTFPVEIGELVFATLVNIVELFWKLRLVELFGRLWLVDDKDRVVGVRVWFASVSVGCLFVGFDTFGGC